MNVNTIKGIVQSHTKKGFSLPDGGSLVDNSLTILSGDTKTVVHKYTKADTTFDLTPGTEVQVSFDAQQKTGSKGDYTINKVIKDGLTVLKGESPAGTTTGTSSSSSTAKVSTTLSTSYDSSGKLTDKQKADGARNGMIAGNAVDLAIARGEVTTDGLKQAAKDVLDLTFFVESGAKLEAKVKKPKETKLTTTKTTELAVVDLQTLDNQDDTFEFEG